LYSSVHFCARFLIVFRLFFSWHLAHLVLHSFPTRRSSDLAGTVWVLGGRSLLNVAATLEVRFDEMKVEDGDVTGVLVVASSDHRDRKSTRLNSSHVKISYAVFCLKKKKNNKRLHWLDSNKK